MIREEYPMPPRTARGGEGMVRRETRGIMGRGRPWLWRLGLLVLLVVLGLAGVGLVNASGLKTRVLAGIATACGRDTGAFSLLDERPGVRARSHSSVTVCEELVRLQPADASARVMLANAYTDTGRTKEAMSCYQEALVLDPNCFDAHLGMGKAYLGQGSCSEAIGSYRKALRIRPDSAAAHLSLGLALSNAGKYEEAMQAFQKARELDPTIVETQVMTGKAYLQAGMCAQAIECLKGAVQTDQEHAQAYFNLGRAYLRVGDKGLALEQQRILRSLDPTLAGELLDMINQ
jgi:tetratricopeptide (TPR) repeat protein